MAMPEKQRNRTAAGIEPSLSAPFPLPPNAGHSGGSTSAALVDVETHKAQAFSWWLEVRWDQHQWLIESSVRQGHQDGQDVRIEFPDRVAESLHDLVQHLRHATHDLLASAKDFDFDCVQ